MEERSQRPSKADLEEDEFLEWVLRAAQFVRDRAHLFIGGIVAAVAVVAIAAFVQHQREEARGRAAALLFQATVADQTGQIDNAIRLTQQLVEEYAGTPSAAQATILLANRYFAQGRYGEAQRLYQSYLDGGGDLPPMVYAARTGLAACQEAQGDLEGAARAYTSYADDHPNTAPSALALMSAARCYSLLGDGSRQRASLERIAREYPQTPVAQRAREQLSARM